MVLLQTKKELASFLNSCFTYILLLFFKYFILIMIDKKKLKEQYKNMIPPKGVFIIKNNKNNKIFMGSSLNLKSIDFKNFMMLDSGLHFNSELQKDWNIFGKDSFSFEILELLDIKDDTEYNYDEDLKILEMIWFDKLKPIADNGYNKNEKIRLV